MRGLNELIVEIGNFCADAEDGSFSILMKEVEVFIEDGNEEDSDALGGGFVDIFDIKCADIKVNYTQVSDTDEVEYQYYDYEACPSDIQEFIFEQLDSFLTNYTDGFQYRNKNRIRLA